MSKVYKSGNPNNKKMTVLFVVQVVLGVLPVLLLAAFVFWFGSDNLYAALFIIIGMFLCSVVYFVAARRYNVLLSGYRGEKTLMKLSKKLKNENVTVFYNLPIRYKRNRSELDMLIISESGILTVEVKNHSGTIFGNDNDDKWKQVKTYKNGKSTEIEMDNPLKQIRRQREILKSILRSEGYDLWVDSVLYFSSPIVRLKLNLRSDSYVCSSEEDLLKFIRNYKSKSPLSEDDIEKITKCIRNLSI